MIPGFQPMGRQRSFTITGLPVRRPRGLLTVVAGYLFWASLCAGLVIASPKSTIRGTVKTKTGQPVSRAAVSARASDGNVLASTRTDSRGEFSLHLTKPGICKVAIECPQCGKVPAQTVTIGGEVAYEVNFVVSGAGKIQTSDSNLLGSVRFYTKPDFKGGDLADPSAGGGYSDAASVQAGRMVNQYLAHESAPSAAEHGGPTAGAPPRPESAEHLEDAGRAMLASRHFERAITLFEKAVARYPDSSRLRMGLGLALYGAGKYQAASNALCESARLAPDDPSPILLLAEASQFVPRPDAEAGNLLGSFSQRHSQNAVGHYAYGIYLLKLSRVPNTQHDLDRAQGELERAVELDGNNAAAHLELGIVYDQQGAVGRAIHQYQEAIRANSDLAAAHYRLARDYAKAGEKTKAAAEAAELQKLRKTAE